MLKFINKIFKYILLRKWLTYTFVTIGIASFVDLTFTPIYNLHPIATGWKIYVNCITASTIGLIIWPTIFESVWYIERSRMVTQINDILKELVADLESAKNQND